MKTIQLGDRHFPTVGVVCPVHDSDPDKSVEDRRLSPSRAYQTILSESGALFDIQLNEDGTVGLTISSVVCTEHGSHGDDLPLWLPVILMLDTDTRTLRPWHRHGGEWSWHRADPEWVAESIDRWSRWPVVDLPDGPRVIIDNPEET